MWVDEGLRGLVVWGAMNKNVIVVVVAILVGVGAVAVVGMTRNKKPAGMTTEVRPTPTVAVAPTGAVIEGSEDVDGDVEAKEFTVEGSNFKFSPAEIRVKKGDTVRILFKNVGGMMHDWVVDEFDARTNQIDVGEEEEIEFVADKAGTFEYYCSVGSHRANGMVGKLIVE